MSGKHATKIIDTQSSKRLDSITHQWDRVVRHQLRELAHRKWPAAHLLGLFPIHSYRLRKQVEPGMTTWWIEQDISPYDLYLCKAYRVEMSLSESGSPELIVYSGTAIHPVAPINVEALRIAITQAGSEEPLVVNRQFGDALDP